MKKPFRVGVLGVASIAKKRMFDAFMGHPDFTLQAISSREWRRAEAAARQLGCTAFQAYEDLVTSAEIDVVYIPLPTNLHFPWALLAIRNGKHVLVEKPLCTSSEEARVLLAEAQQMGVGVGENFMFLHHSQTTWLKQTLVSGEIGQVRLFRAQFGFPPLGDKGNIRYSKELGGGALFDAGCYPLRASLFFLDEPLEVRSVDLHFDRELQVDVWGSITLRTDSGIVAQLSFGFDNAYQCNVEFWGSKSKMTAHRAFTAGPEATPAVTFESDGEARTVLLPPDDQAFNSLSAFSKMIQSSVKPAAGHTMLNQARILEATWKEGYGF